MVDDELEKVKSRSYELWSGGELAKVHPNVIASQINFPYFYLNMAIFFIIINIKISWMVK